MAKPGIPKVYVDTAVAEAIPTVIVSGGSKKPSESSGESEITNHLPPPLKRIVNFFLDFVETAVVALSIFVVVYLFLVQPHEIKGGSMEPSFHNNEYILTDKISYRFKEPKRGDVVIFKAPKNPDVDYIKRIIGLPGERIKIQNGGVYINGKKLNEPYIRDITVLTSTQYLQEGVETTVPSGYFFVMGDNRTGSMDSREFGPIAENIIIGHAIIRYWPLSTLGLVSGISY